MATRTRASTKQPSEPRAHPPKHLRSLRGSLHVDQYSGARRVRMVRVVGLLVAMWMGARVGRRRVRRATDLAADAQLVAVMNIVPDSIVLADERNNIKARMRRPSSCSDRRSAAPQ
ncbi:MAG: hypothetical protein ACXVQS_12345 [Actinomycetota bacterium]